MNNPSPLVPQGSLLEQKNRSRSRVKIAFFCVVGIHVAGLMVLLMQGCKREQEQPQPPVDTGLPTITDAELPPLDTNAMVPVPMDTNLPVMPPSVEPAPPPAPMMQEYTIQRGDSFYSIGKKLNIPMKAIQDANPNVDPTKLQIGQKIVLPPATATAIPPGTEPGVAMPPAVVGGEQTYIVKSGDTLTKIAREHGTTVKALRSANNLQTDRIRVGDKLVIPARAAAPAPPPIEAFPVAPSAPVPSTPTAPPGE